MSFIRKLKNIVFKLTSPSIKLVIFLLTASYAILPFASVRFIEMILEIFIGSRSDSMMVIWLACFVIIIGLIPALEYFLTAITNEFRLNFFELSHFRKMINVPPEYFGEQDKLDNLNKSAAFFGQSWNGYQRIVETAPKLIGNLLSLIILATYTEPIMRIVILGFVLLLLCISKYSYRAAAYEKAIHDDLRENKKYLKFYFAQIDDDDALREIKASNLEQYMVDNISQKNSELQKKLFSRIEYNWSIYFVKMLNLLPTLLSVFVLIFGYLNEIISIELLIIYLSILKLINKALADLFKDVEKLKSDLLLYDDFIAGEIFSFNIDRKKEKKAIDFSNKVMIKFDQVSYKYPQSSEYAIKDFSYTFEFPLSYSLVGESGCGKTTLVKMICGFIFPTKGRIIVNGADIKDVNMEEYRRYISTVFQNSSLIPFSIHDNITFGKYFAEDSSTENSISEIYQKTINRLPQGINTIFSNKLDSRGISFSGGERQLFLLLRSDKKPSKITILDEATSAMDANNEMKSVQNLINSSKKKLSIIVTHRLAVTKYTDKILVINQGSLIESGNFTELIDNSIRFKKLYDLQSEGYDDEI